MATRVEVTVVKWDGRVVDTAMRSHTIRWVTYCQPGTLTTHLPLVGCNPGATHFMVMVPASGGSTTRFSVRGKQREHEQPFIVHSISELDNAITTSFSYYPLLSHMSNRKRTSVERLESNKYMYYHKPGAVRPNGELYSDWKPPQQDVHMSFGDFLKEAETAEASAHANASVSLLYLTLSAIEVNNTHVCMYV